MFSSVARLIKRKMLKDLQANMPPVFSISDDSAVQIAAKLILQGKVIALPTDTIYGIAASAQNNNGIRNLYEIKKRDSVKPLSICVSSVNEVSLYGETSHLDRDMLEELLPGAVTIVLKRKSLLNLKLNPNTQLIGIRIPKCLFVQNLSRICGVPLALTSANVSSEPSPLNISEFQHLWPSLGGVFDGGILGNNRSGSTVIDLSEPGIFKIIRPGSALEMTTVIVKKFGLLQKE